MLSTASSTKKHYQSQHSGPVARIELGQPAFPASRQTHCEYPGCGRKFKGKVNLQRYYQTMHSSLRLWKPFRCISRVKRAELQCDNAFVNKYTMARHYKNVHVGSLDSCDWKIPDKNTLLLHILKAQ